MTTNENEGILNGSNNDTAPTEPAPKKTRATRRDKGTKRGPRGPIGPRSETAARREAREAAKAKAKLEKELAKEVEHNAELIKQAEAIGFDLTDSDDRIHQLEQALGLGSEPEIDEEAAAE